MSGNDFGYGFSEPKTKCTKYEDEFRLEPVAEIEDLSEFEIESPKMNPQFGNPIQLDFI